MVQSLSANDCFEQTQNANDVIECNGQSAWVTLALQQTDALALCEELNTFTHDGKHNHLFASN